MDLGFKLILSNRNLKHPTSRQIFGDTSGLLCKNDQILRPKDNEIYIWTYASDIETKLQMFFRELLLQICLIRKVEKNGFIDLASDDDWGSFSFLKFRVSFRNSLKVIDQKKYSLRATRNFSNPRQLGTDGLSLLQKIIMQQCESLLHCNALT